MSKPEFDPSKPFTAVDNQGPKPEFDATKPFQAINDSSTPPEPQWSDLPKNAVTNLKQKEQGVPEMAKNLAALTAIPYGGIPTMGDVSQMGKMALQAPGMVKGALGNLYDTITNPKKEMILHPIDTAMNVASVFAPMLMPEAEAAKAATAVPAEASLADTIGQRIAARTTSQALDLNPRALGKLATKAGLTPEQEVLQLGAKANELIPDLIKPLDTANSKVGKVLAAHDDAGELLGKFAKTAKQAEGANFPEKAVVGDLRTAAENYYGVDGGENALLKTADRLEKLQESGNLNFETLSKVKSAIGEGFSKKDVPAGTRETYDILNNATGSVVDRLSVDNPSLAPAINQAKQIYTLTSRLLPAMSRAATKEVSGASLGSGVLAKAIPAAIGGAFGGPVGAGLAMGAKYLQEAVAPDLGENLAYLSMKPLSKAVGVAKGIPSASLDAGLRSGVANTALNEGNQSPIQVEDLIKKLKAKYDARRKF